MRAGVPRPWVLNGLHFSQLLGPEDLATLDFGTERLHWKLLAAGGAHCRGSRSELSCTAAAQCRDVLLAARHLCDSVWLPGKLAQCRILVM